MNKSVIKLSPSALIGQYDIFLNNWYIIQLSQKSTPSDAFDELYQVVLDEISDNMTLLVESVNSGAIKTTDTATN